VTYSAGGTNSNRIVISQIVSNLGRRHTLVCGYVSNLCKGRKCFPMECINVMHRIQRRCNLSLCYSGALATLA
jgi:hypothetical protein